jgi:hypothetical protein
MTDEAAPNLGGRPTAYRPEFVEQAANYCSLGATDDDLADFFGVSQRTINTWKIAHPEFGESVKVGKEPADRRVKRSLYQQALGYDYTEEQAIKIRIGQFEERVEVVEVRRHMPANVTASIFWAKNRLPAEFRDKQDVELTGKDGGPIDIRGGVSGLLAAAKLAVADDPGAT